MKWADARFFGGFLWRQQTMAVRRLLLGAFVGGARHGKARASQRHVLALSTRKKWVGIFGNPTRICEANFLRVFERML
jgi:hypothetical protein